MTPSIENAITSDSFKTNVVELDAKDIKSLQKSNWLFDWKAEANQANKNVYKLLLLTIQTFRDLLVYKIAMIIYSCH